MKLLWFMPTNYPEFGAHPDPGSIKIHAFGNAAREKERKGKRERDVHFGDTLKFSVAYSRHAHPISPLESSYVCQRGSPTSRGLGSLCSRERSCTSERRQYKTRRSEARWGEAMRDDILCPVPLCPSWTKISPATSGQDPGPCIRRGACK